MIPTLVEEPPRGDDWSTEVKFDGMRCQVVIDAGGVRILGRDGSDLTNRARSVAEAARAELDVSAAIIDGVLVHPRESEQSCTDSLPDVVPRSDALTFMAFDLLHLDGEDRRKMPLFDRRGPLHGMIRPGGRIRYSEALLGTPTDLFGLVGQMKLGGIVCKRRRSVYVSGSTADWVEVRTAAAIRLETVGMHRDGRA